MTRLSLSQQLQTALADKERLFEECQQLRAASNSATAALEQLQSEVFGLRAQNSDFAEKLADTRRQLEAARKESASNDCNYKYANARAERAEAELEQVHAILDSLEGAPSRKFSVEGAYGETTRTLSARFAVALCTIFRLTGSREKV